MTFGAFLCIQNPVHFFSNYENHFIRCIKNLQKFCNEYIFCGFSTSSANNLFKSKSSKKFPATFKNTLKGNMEISFGIKSR